MNICLSRIPPANNWRAIKAGVFLWSVSIPTLECSLTLFMSCAYSVSLPCRLIKHASSQLSPMAAKASCMLLIPGIMMQDSRPSFFIINLE